LSESASKCNHSGGVVVVVVVWWWWWWWCGGFFTINKTTLEKIVLHFSRLWQLRSNQCRYVCLSAHPVIPLLVLFVAHEIYLSLKVDFCIIYSESSS
jgi:hypothetical protein